MINSMFFMELFGKMELNTYLCRAKKERDGLRHQRYITQTGYRTLPEFAKKETLRIIPQQFQARQHDTVQLTYPTSLITDAKVRLFFDIAPEKNTKEYEFHINMQIRNDLLRKGKNNSL